MPVSMLIGGVGSAASGILSGIVGFGQRSKGNKLLAQTPFPTEQMPPEVLANQQIAQSQAIQGMPSEEYANAMKRINESQIANLNAATTRQGGVQNIGAIEGGSAGERAGLSAQSAEMRRQNVSQLLGVNEQVASWRDKLFDWNQRQKYIQNYNYAMGLVGQGNQNIMSGADKLLAPFAKAANTAGSSPNPYTPISYSSQYQPQMADIGTGPQSPAGVFAGGGMSTAAPASGLAGSGGVAASQLSSAFMSNPALLAAF